MNQETNSQESKIKFTYDKSGLIDGTIGRIGQLLTHLKLGTLDNMLEDFPEENIPKLEERYKDLELEGNIEVYLNHSPLFKNLKRLFEKGRRNNLFARVLFGIPYTIGQWLGGQITRADSYNPYTETAQVYHPNETVAMHEIGHAEDFDASEHPTIRSLIYSIPFIRSKLEWNASKYAMEHMTEDERKQNSKILEPALGTYLAFDTAETAVNAALLAGATISSPAISLILNAAPWVGAGLGHLYSRVIKDPDTNVFISNSKQSYLDEPSGREPALSTI
ncbi:hypothetical protein GF362_00955 [Candidatus Dojkabacteria bacterium]|nr:hypothetical protein [Candidatus Dojkabacteria bacterium]